MKALTRTDETLIISASKREIAHDVWVLLGFTFVWVVLLLVGLSLSKFFFRVILLVIVFLLAGFFVLLIQELVNTIKTKLVFNRQKNQVIEDGKITYPLNQIDHLLITIDYDTYELWAIFKKDPEFTSSENIKLFIDESSDKNKILSLTRKIADFIRINKILEY